MRLEHVRWMSMVISYIGCIEQPTPMPEEDLQMLRLGVSRRNKEDEVLWAIEDIIGPKELWPEWVRDQLFWETKMTDELCLKYCSPSGISCPPT